MSHFPVLVITATRPSEDDLRPILQPWHEYECTGIKDQYVVDVDATDEVMEKWNAEGPAVKLADGSIKSKHDPRFWNRGKGGVISSRDTFVLPVGASEITIPQRDLCAASGITLDAFAEEYGGWKRKGDRFYRFTNPNSKWDWWVIGGRWTGFFAPGYDPEADPDNIEKCDLCRGTGKRRDMEVANGCNGCGGKGSRTKWPTKWAQRGNQIRVGDLELDEIRTQAEIGAARSWDRFHQIVGGRKLPVWEDLREQHGVEKARAIYNGDPDIQALRAANFHFWEADRGLIGERAQYLAVARMRALETWAVVKDGKWYEKGVMGWWAMSHSEKEPEVWSAMYAKMLDDLSKDQWLTIVDCHI